MAKTRLFIFFLTIFQIASIFLAFWLISIAIMLTVLFLKTVQSHDPVGITISITFSVVLFSFLGLSIFVPIFRRIGDYKKKVKQKAGLWTEEDEGDRIHSVFGVFRNLYRVLLFSGLSYVTIFIVTAVGVFSGIGIQKAFIYAEYTDTVFGVKVDTLAFSIGFIIGAFVWIFLGSYFNRKKEEMIARHACRNIEEGRHEEEEEKAIIVRCNKKCI